MSDAFDPGRLPARPDGRPTLSVCIILKDSAAWLPPLLRQCDRLADEILLVDGGSSDATPAIAARFARTRLLRRRWDGNHCRQRNFGWDHARGDWLLFLDTDELLSPALESLAPGLLRSRFRSIAIPRCWMVSDRPPRYIAGRPHHPDRQYRLFRNLPELRWDERRRIHGQVGPRESLEPLLKLRHTPLLHLVLLAHGRGEREARVAHYESAQDDSLTGNRNYYLYEDGRSRVRGLGAWRWRLLAERTRLAWHARLLAGEEHRRRLQPAWGAAERDAEAGALEP